MKSKTLFIILGILAVGVIAVWGISSRGQNTDNAYSLPSIAKDKVESITIKAAGNEFVIKKSAEGWLVNDKSADALSVDGFLDSFIGLEVKGPYGFSEENHSRFSVDEANGIDVKINDINGELLHIIIGKAGADYSSTYFKPFDEANVYTASSSWSSSVFKTANDWRDKNMWSFSEGELKKIIATQNSRIYEAVEDNGAWSISYGGVTKTADSYAAYANSMTAAGYTADEAAMNSTLEFYGEGDTELLKYDVGSDDSSYYLKNAGMDESYEVSKSLFEQFWPPSVFDTIE